MKSNNNPIRPLGQRTISSFIFPSSNPAQHLESSYRSKDFNKDSPVSLSDFLNKKLQKPSTRPRSVKSQPFLSPLGRKTDSCGVDGSNDGRIGSKLEDKERKSEVNEVFFQQFKKPAAGENGIDIHSCSNGPAGTTGNGADSSISHSVQSSFVGKWGPSESAYLQRTDPDGTHVISTVWRRLQDREKKHGAVPKQPLAVGKAQRSKRKPDQETLSSKKKRRKLYNHYANGNGWWDCDMEGVDSDEVGIGEVWEGVGSTTLGGIEWH
ncbi:hypothetical protein LINPERHAP2_LOCUS14155 [Linum perenne]